jgi:hypothetical protein
MIGFLYCNHEKIENQEENFWILVNPKLHDSIKKEELLKFLSYLSYIVTDLIIQYISQFISSKKEIETVY